MNMSGTNFIRDYRKQLDQNPILRLLLTSKKSSIKQKIKNNSMTTIHLNKYYLDEETGKYRNDSAINKRETELLATVSGEFWLVGTLPN